MPYIEPERRPLIVVRDDGHDGHGLEPDEEPQFVVIGSSIDNAGELNYAITELLRFYLDTTTGHRYRYYNEAIGVLECAKMELYRRLVAPYEDEKIKENGDVY